MEKSYTLENEFLLIAVKAQGAELTSIFNKKTALEYLWQAGKEWPKHAPILFPIVGQLKDNSYQYKTKTYHLERHGFARNRKFTLSSYKKEKITFTLTDDEESRKIYPFHFRLSVHYEI